MPSPFPGMDPYFEGHYWSTLHSQLAPEFARQLSPLLSARYVALTERWMTLADYPESPNDPLAFKPDTNVAVARESAVQYAAGATAPPTHRLRSPIPMRRRQTHVVIRDVDGMQLVTVIELLSPANKHGEGRAHYGRKRAGLVRRGVNLLEVDLLHEGKRVPGVRSSPNAPYTVTLTRAETAPVMDAWAIPLVHPLPTVPVPLAAGDADVPLDLQRALTTVYDALRYERVLHYDRRPPVRMPAEELAWTRDLLAPKGYDVSRWDAEEPAP